MRIFISLIIADNYKDENWKELGIYFDYKFINTYISKLLL
ncbi:hypothetical protein GFO_0825 [Christiangramia forsetii KT0803]|uniref:Uncharacterized protein n=1 Tax=Christiangramia forsetii (strain DSM 17595 / CGMCC 1.15422 / KT0803) TaxID=411154 RepID=A0LZK4_CHRFK|nr:hypothetical protein GFO_0825 [Christiangramia forsetii KT0803]